MLDILSTIQQEASGLPFTEMIAVALSVIYIVLAARGSLWCWPAAFISSSIYAVIFFNVQLKFEALLQVYYVAMAVYGFKQWSSAQKNQQADALPVISMPLQSHARWIVGLSLLSVSLAFGVTQCLNTDFAYLDAATTCFSIYATWLVTRRVLENWLYWIVIDFVSIYLYVNKALYFVTALFIFYVIFAAWGYLKWRTLFNEHRYAPTT